MKNKIKVLVRLYLCREGDVNLFLGLSQRLSIVEGVRDELSTGMVISYWL